MNLNKEMSKSVAENPTGYIFLAAISMCYMAIMLCNAVLTNRYVGYDALFILGGTLTSPFVFILNDIISEIYGYKIVKYLVIFGFASQTLFAILCEAAILAPHPTFFKEQAAYQYILGPSLLWINFSGCIAYLVANLVNSRIITRWKVLLKGKKFWLRSLGSSTFSEALYSFIAILMMEIQSIPLKSVFKVMLVSYLIKVIYCLIFAGPSQIFVNYIKKVTKIDVYDFPQDFTPFKYVSKKFGIKPSKKEFNTTYD